MNSEKRLNPDLCCGCGGCAQICRSHAISMAGDAEGFYKPNIDLSRCVQCGECISVCPMFPQNFHKAIKASSAFSKKYYAALATNGTDLKRSSSGGVFSTAARQVLEQGGTVFGCALNRALTPSHIGIDQVENLDLLRRSKYVQSDTGQTFAQVKDLLFANKPVLYVGTPCQIAGLRLFLKKDDSNLLTLDLICHGVPSAKLFQKHLTYLEHRNRDKVENYEFRLKNERGTKHYSYTVFYEKTGARTGFYYKDPYFTAFYDENSYNECCYKCPFASLDRCGDLTIGDYHWASNYHKEFAKISKEKNYALSCILVNTEKGMKFLNLIQDKLMLVPTQKEFILEKNKNLIRPTLRKPDRSKFYSDIEKMGYQRWVLEYYFSKNYFRHLPFFQNLFLIRNKFLNFHRK